MAVTVGADLDTAGVLESALRHRVVGRRFSSERPSYGVVMPAPGNRDQLRPLAQLRPRTRRALPKSRDSERVVRALLAQLATHSPIGEGLLFEAVAFATARRWSCPARRRTGSRSHVGPSSGVRVTDAPNMVVVPRTGNRPRQGDRLSPDIDVAGPRAGPCPPARR